MERTLRDAEFFEVVGRDQWGPRLKSKFAQGIPRPDASLQTARELGLDAIVVGEVTKYECKDKDNSIKLLDSPSSDDSPGMVISTAGTKSRAANVTIELKLVDVRTGMIRTELDHTDTHKDERSNGDQLPSSRPIMNELLADCATRLGEKLVPHQRPLEVHLEKPRWFEAGAVEINRGNRMAKEQRWHEAEKHWRSALAANPSSVPAKHNLAISREAQHDLPGAEALLLEAASLEPGGACTVALERVRTARNDHQKVLTQIANRDRAKLAPMENGSLLASRTEPVSHVGGPRPPVGNPQISQPQPQPWMMRPGIWTWKRKQLQSRRTWKQK